MLQDFKTECRPYPGEYVPRSVAEWEGQLGSHPDYDVVSQPFVNITEFQDNFKLEVVVPGVRREDIVIRLNGKMLSVYVSHDYLFSEIKKNRLHEFDGCYFERHIRLPANCDPEFISAEYRNGIIVMYIPKSDWAEPVFNRRVVVY